MLSTMMSSKCWQMNAVLVCTQRLFFSFPKCWLLSQDEMRWMHRVALGGCSGAIHFHFLFNFLVYSYFLKIINFFAMKKLISFSFLVQLVSFSFVRVNGEQSQLLLQIRYQTEVRIAGRHSVSWNWSTLVLVGCLGLLKPLTLSQVSKTEWKKWNWSSARYLVGPSWELFLSHYNNNEIMFLS